MDPFDPMLLLGGLMLAGGAIFALAMMLRRPNLPPPSAFATLQAMAPRSPQPGELGQQLQELYRQVVDRHDAQELERAVGAAGSQLQSNPLFKAMNPTAGAAAPKPPASA